MVRGKGNALHIDLVTALLDALDRLERSPARAGIITGQGNVFGAGVDLPALADCGADYVRRFVPLLQRFFQRLATFPKPLVAAVNGHAIAGGAIIMLASDQRLLARGTARIGLTEIRVGVLFPAWALEIVRFTTPPPHFATLITTGRTFLPEEALLRGLVDELVEPAHLVARAHAVAEELAALADGRRRREDHIYEAKARLYPFPRENSASLNALFQRLIWPALKRRTGGKLPLWREESLCVVSAWAAIPMES
jgi:enoyl-CoA hydratase